MLALHKTNRKNENHFKDTVVEGVSGGEGKRGIGVKINGRANLPEA